MEGIQFNTQSFTELEVEAEGLNKQYSLGLGAKKEKIKENLLLTYPLPLIHHLLN